MSSCRRSTTANKINKSIKYVISRPSSSIFINNLNLNARCSARVDLIEKWDLTPPKSLHQDNYTDAEGYPAGPKDLEIQFSISQFKKT